MAKAQKATPSAIRYLYATATQGGADAFVQATIETGLSSLASFAYRVREIMFEMSNFNLAAGAQWEMAVCHTSQAAMPTIDNRALIEKQKIINGMVTSGAVFAEQIRAKQYQDADAPLIVTDQIFFQLDSAATTVANTVRCRVAYEVVELSDLDRLTILNAVSLGF